MKRCTSESKKTSQKIRELTGDLFFAFGQVGEGADRAYFEWYHAKNFDNKKLSVGDECKIYVAVVNDLKQHLRKVLDIVKQIKQIIPSEPYSEEYLIDTIELLNECESCYNAVVCLNKEILRDDWAKKQKPKDKLAAIHQLFKDFSGLLRSPYTFYSEKNYHRKIQRLVATVELKEQDRTRSQIKRRPKGKLRKHVATLLESVPDIKQKKAADTLNKNYAGKYRDTSASSVGKVLANIRNEKNNDKKK